MVDEEDREGFISPSKCSNCAGVAWVCENHADVSWEACNCGGAGAPCPVCNTEMAFAGMRARIIDECAAIALAPFDWGFGKAPTTYRALADRIGKRIEALKYSPTDRQQGKDVKDA